MYNRDDEIKIGEIVFYVVVAFLVLFFLTGCSPRVITKYETVEVYRTLDIPEEMLDNCSVSKPPEKDVYISKTFNGKEELLTNYILDLHTDIKNCNTKLGKIKQLTKEQKLILERINNANK